MKKLIGFGIAAMMVMGLAGGAMASATDWLIYMKATDQVGANYLNNQNIYGWKTGATDAVESNDAANTAGSGSAVCLGAFDLGAGAANNGFSKDLRAPGSTAFGGVWNLKLWLQAGSNATSIKLSLWNPTGTYALPVDKSKKYNVSFGGDGFNAAKTFTFDGSVNGAAATPAITWEFLNAQQYKGLDKAMTLTISPVTTVVPEPGSIVAMLSGLVGLAGYGIRRRK